MTNWLLLLPPEGGARQVATNLLHAFKQKVSSPHLHFFDCKKYLSAFNIMLKNPDETMSVDLLNQSLVVQCLQYDTTHLFVPALCPVTLFTLNLLKKQSITTIHWFIEDHRRATYWKDVIAGYSWFLAVQKGPIPEMCENNNCRFAYLPTAASEESITCQPKNISQNKNADVAFVGIPSFYRVKILEYLLSQNISLAIAGEGWDAYKGPLSRSIVTDKWIDSQYAAQIISSASIGINISLTESSEELSDMQISPRVYDILSTGAVLLTEDIPLLHETIGDCHFYTFTTQEEAADNVHQILSDISHDSIKKKIEENQEIILQKHTWEKRVQQIIDLCS